ncbi:MAG: aminoacyl-tRNA hydrolase [Candidatus Acidiferrales bacterium]|jgi:PTH1 family peptidyl-tRNA hydrolase
MPNELRLIVGLGNPGPEYAWTPHNLGFFVVDRLAESAGIRVERPEAKSYVGRGKIAGQEVVLAKPQTMMNLSGLAVGDLLHRFDCEPSQLIVAYDDVALPWGMIRVRETGSAGGHNGLKSVIGVAGTMDFPRVRLGVEPEHPIEDLAAYVLRPMRKGNLEAAADMIDQAAEAVSVILAEGVSVAMNRFNRRATPPDDDEGGGHNGHEHEHGGEG